MSNGKAAVPYEEKLPAHIKDQQGGTARGSEDVGTEDVAIPRLQILQSLSPQIDKKDDTYIKGAEAGMLFNATTGVLYGESVFFVPVYFRKDWMVWKKRKSGGGFLGAHGTPQLAADALMEALADPESGSENDYETVETPQQFGILVNQGGAQDIVISMPKSQMKKSRMLNTLVREAGGDRWNMVYEVRAIGEENAKGKFYNYDVKPRGYTPKELWMRAEALYEAIRVGARTINMENLAEEGEDAGSPVEM